MIPRADCSACGSRNITAVIQLEGVPRLCNLLLENRREALDQPTVSIVLSFCHQCGHLFNSAFDEQQVEYRPGYENSLRGSERYREYDAEIVRGLIKRYDLHQKTVVEIGCGRGEFLRILCREGRNRGIGFDPSYPGIEDEAGEGEPEVRIMAERYESRHRDLNADFVCSRHALEHMPEPREFLRSVAGAIGAPDVPVFIEVPNGLFTLRDGGIWDIIHEHCSYFTPESLRAVMLASGFNSIEVAESFGRQFLTAYARSGAAAVPAKNSDLAELEGLVARFADSYRRTISTWRERLAEMEQLGRKIVVWGAGAKGTIFLNLLGPRNVEYVVDVNPMKHGRFIPCTGHRIESPEALIKDSPDVIIGMNPIYADEIRRQVSSMGLGAEFLWA